MSSAIDLIICPKKYSKALGKKKKLLIVCGVKFLKRKTRTGLCLELMCSVQKEGLQHSGGEKMLYFACTKGCRATS